MLPKDQLLALRLGPIVDADSQLAQLEQRNLIVNLTRHIVDLRTQVCSAVGHLFAGQSLVGKAHVHHRRRVPLGSSQVDQAPFGNDPYPGVVELLGHK